MVGNHQCVALVRHYAGAPATLAWKQGEAVLGNRLLRKGTAIATFVNGKYANHQQGNHAALYMGQPVRVHLQERPQGRAERDRYRLPVSELVSAVLLGESPAAAISACSCACRLTRSAKPTYATAARQRPRRKKARRSGPCHSTVKPKAQNWFMVLSLPAALSAASPLK